MRQVPTRIQTGRIELDRASQHGQGLLPEVQPKGQGPQSGQRGLLLSGRCLGQHLLCLGLQAQTPQRLTDINLQFSTLVNASGMR